MKHAVAATRELQSPFAGDDSVKSALFQDFLKKLMGRTVTNGPLFHAYTCEQEIEIGGIKATKERHYITWVAATTDFEGNVK